MKSAQSGANNAVDIVVKSCPAPEFKELTYPRFQNLLTDIATEKLDTDRWVVVFFVIVNLWVWRCFRCLCREGFDGRTLGQN